VATNKHAIIRYQTLDKCFRNPGRKYFIEDLVEACSNAIYEFSGNDNGIKRRQILEDIKFMESMQGWNIPLERIREGHRVYYMYEDKNFSINNQPLNETEENQLREALLTLSRFKGMPQFEWVDEISARLDSGLRLSHNADKIIEFDQNNYLKGLEHITPLYNSILYWKAINIEYKSFKQDISQSIIFHPYFLKQYNNRWYVFGKNDASQLIMNLALDRITAIEESKKKYIPNKTIDFNEYFEDIIGVTLDIEGKVENIVLKISNELLPYIKTKPIHGSQKLKNQSSSYALITLDLIPNYELESLILSYGEGIEILLPESLRQRLSKRLESMFLNYQNNNADVLHSK
jgi:predicted DNA-binding transcriptional regulator YafY